MKNEHHWRIHVAWFEREVRFLDAESARIAEETFDHLTSSGVSIKALEEMLGTNFRRAIGDRFMDKIDCIIKKFSKEIKCAEIDFDLAKDSPPIDKNFPPMSGAIYWAKDWMLSFLILYGRRQSPIYDTFRAKLKDYETSRYNEWKSRRYRVNFTTDLSDTLAEVKHLDSLGFSVPEVAKNMSLQEERLIDEIFPAEEELLFCGYTGDSGCFYDQDILELHGIPWALMSSSLWGISRYLLSKTKINRIELIRKEIQSIADILSKTDLFSFECYSKMNIYEAIKELLLSNLDRYKEFIESRDPRFYIETILVDNNVSTDPSAPKVLDVMVGVIKEILEATKIVDGEIKPLRSSMHDEIISFIPSIIDRVTHIQSLIVNILKESDNYLVSWKSYRTLWKFNKQQTCENFGRTIPTCVDFDEKLLFYYNLNRSIRNKEDHKDFKVMRLGLTKLKDGIQEHIIEWIQVLGKMLDSTATEKLKIPLGSSGILQESTQTERYRTLDMYGISGDKSMVVLAKNLTSKWEELYKMSKQVYFSIEKLKEKLSDIESSKILRFQSRLEELQGDFRQNGPSSKRTTLSNGLKALHKFKDLIGLFKEEAETLNGKQKVFKQIPITHFPILRSLEKEMETIRDIYAIYEKLQDLFETLQDLPWGEYFTLAPGSQNYSKQKIFNIKREISFLEKSSTTHEGEGGLVVLGKLMDQLYSFEQYLNHLDCLQKGGLSQRHWKTLIEKTGLIFQEGDPQSYPDFKLKPFFESSTQYSCGSHNLVEDDQNLDLMLSMKYAEPFKEKLEKHREILSKTGSVLKFIYETQNRCYSYAKVFISSEKQSYFENFGQIFKTYKGLMDELSRRVIVLDITLEDKTWKTYNEISRLLDSFSKRQSFPRLYFLSNEELLILLGGCSPLALDQGKFVLKDDYMRVARKLFGFGVLSITLHKNHNHDYNPSALLLNNGDGLKIPGRASNNANSSFSQTSSNYLNWFSMIVKEMKKSFASTIKKALNLMTSENIETFLSRSESLSLICYEVYWTETLENFMEKGFHGLLSLLNEDIEVILGMEMKDSSKRRDHDRKNNFLNLLLSKKLGLSILIENQIRSKEDFTYQADFLRSYWNKNLETLTLKQGLGALDFEYEFQVPKTHFLTESPQATYGIMMALGWQRRSFCISGYPGSGKTSIIESMASRLGRYCVKIDNMIGFKNMEYRILELLAQTCVADCWLVIENIENIPQDMLSKISNPLYQIEAAKELRLQQFNLTPSKEINLGPNASVFFTTRGSTNYNNSIPQSLRSRWRHISLIPPKDLSPWISWKLSVLGYSGIERLTKLIILSIDQITNLSDSLMNHIGPYKLINDIFGSIEMSEGSESGSVMSAILHVTEYYILEEFKPGVKEFLRTRFGNEEIPPRSSLRNLILEERINSIWDQEFEKVEGLPGCTPSEKQKRSLVKAFQILEDSTGVCVAFIGDTGTGKCLMARVLANLLDSEFLFLSSSLYTAEELLNNNGIITSAIRNSNRKFTIILNPSMSNSIASVVANIIDKGIYINPSNYHSYKVETNSIKFVILLKPDEHLNSILIQRTRIIQLNERRETSISDLYEKLSTIPITDPCLSFDSDQRLQQDFENSTQEESQLSVSSRLNTLVLSYIWSYGATLTDSNSVDDFEKRLRKIVKSYSDDIGLLQEESVFDQMYNGKEWARNENSLRRVVALLVHHGKGVFISGKLEADIWVDQFIKDMPEFHIVQIMLKRVAFTDRCLTQHLLSNMQIKGNRIYYPKSNRKLLYLVKGLSNEVDVDWMIDMSLHKSLHQYDQERDKITLRDVSILATLERGISGASSISKSNIFCPKYYKNQNPKSLDMTLLLPKNPDLSDNDKESINVVYKAYSSYNTNKGSLSSIKALGLTNMNIFSRLLKLDPQSWSKSLMKGLLEPLWSLEERRETLSFLHSHQINPDNEIKNENMGVISQLLDEGEVHHILLIGQGGSGKRALLKNYKPLWYWSFKELMDSSLENKDETRVVKAIESLVIPRDYPSLREQLDLMHQNVSAIVVICLNVEEFKVQDLKRVLSAFMEKFRIIGVPQASIYELKQVTQGFDIDSSILQNFLDIHDKIRTYFETMNIIIGNTSPWKLHKTLSIYKENVSKKKDSLEKAVNKSSFILTFIQKLNSKSLELKSELEIIKTQLNLHTKASLSNSQAIKKLRVQIRGNTQKRRDYDESLNIMSSLTMEDVIRFCSSKPVHESLIEAFLVFTNGHGPGQYEETNPKRSSIYDNVSMNFIKNSEAPENSMGQIILKLCNGAYESAASFEDRLDLEIKIMAYENFVSDKISELEDITKKEDMIQLERQDYLDKKLDHKINMERLEKELETFEAYNTSAGNLLSLLSELGPHWKEEKERTMVILQNLESNEIFETIRDVYLRLLPRRILIQSIDQLFDGQIIHSEDCKKKGRKVDYFGLRDQFWRNILYYPEGSISQNICILHDPDDVYSYVLRKRKYKILHILCESDVQKIQEILRDRLDIVVPNFGGYINGKNENMGLLFRSLISSIPSDCESIVFLLIFEENQISNHETPYINLSLSEESFEDLDRLLKEIIHIHFSEDGRRIREIEGGIGVYTKWNGETRGGYHEGNEFM
ncbi:DNAH [Lepeophtheirus salmonis]|uniref:DNAH n=1 Tax=Lepeophtheirus salmonis TaxID=72036 RepID=A0A7R8CD84_LEPSM|nr:DNAH [Lepeophtheirus salmonis]CAF2777175.1 DNAH [Lepeophtheirus salmonis]